MINLSIPFWLFGTIIGTICFGLLVTALAIGYKVRRLKSQNGREAQIVGMETARLNNHFQENLLGMQVDAVFDSLTALIETERIKLKALVAPTLQSMHASAPQKRQEPVQRNVQDEPAAKKLETLAAEADHGSADQGRSSDLNLSKAERELAEKMRSFQAQNYRKLDAVA